ncbi:MAG: esterase/lipase family protein [Patescibacteria group bacterium]
MNDENANDWRLTPGAKVYDNILDAFDEDSNFHVFYYDWRKSVLESAQKLNSFIEEKIGTESTSVNLIGHSLGGLVGRTCIEKYDGCHTSKLITVGSPHLGVVDVYPAVQAGEIWQKGVMKLVFELLVHYYQRPGETRKDTLKREAPVLRKLLPEFDYLTKNEDPIPWNSLRIKNNLLPQLTNSSLTPAVTETVSGNSKSTLKNITVIDRNWLDETLRFWIDGKPQGTGDYANEGDGTVLATSASLTRLSVPNHEFNLDHGEIISSETALAKIFSLLGKTLPDKEYSSIPETENYLVFVAHSPVELFSPQADTNQHLHPELIIIPNPEDKQYDLQVKGIGNGNYLLSVGQIFGEKVLWNDYPGMAKIGSLETFSFNISPNTPLENPLVISNSSLKNLITQAIDDLKNNVNQEAIKDYQKNFLLYYLEHIETQLDTDPERAIFYSNLFRDAVNFYQKSNVLSGQTSLKLLNKTHNLSTLLESLALNFPKTIEEEQVNQRISFADTAKELAKNNVPDKSSALVYLQALEKLDKATVSDNLYKQYLLSSQAQFLFLESKLIK